METHNRDASEAERPQRKSRMCVMRERLEKQQKEAEEEWRTKLERVELRASALEKDLEREKIRVSVLSGQLENTKALHRNSLVAAAQQQREILNWQKKVKVLEVQASRLKSDFAEKCHLLREDQSTASQMNSSIKQMESKLSKEKAETRDVFDNAKNRVDRDECRATQLASALEGKKNAHDQTISHLVKMILQKMELENHLAGAKLDLETVRTDCDQLRQENQANVSKMEELQAKTTLFDQLTAELEGKMAALDKEMMAEKTSCDQLKNELAEAEERRLAENTAWEKSNNELAKNLSEVEEKLRQSVAAQRQAEEERGHARASLLELERLSSEAEQKWQKMEELRAKTTSFDQLTAKLEVKMAALEKQMMAEKTSCDQLKNELAEAEGRRLAQKTAWDRSNTELAKNLSEVEEKLRQTVAAQLQAEEERGQARASLLELERLSSEAEQRWQKMEELRAKTTLFDQLTVKLEGKMAALEKEMMAEKTSCDQLKNQLAEAEERRLAEKTAWDRSNTELAKNLSEVEEKLRQTVAAQLQAEEERGQARASLLELERLSSEAEQRWQALLREKGQEMDVLEKAKAKARKELSQIKIEMIDSGRGFFSLKKKKKKENKLRISNLEFFLSFF